jgi:hypothetical protein
MKSRVLFYSLPYLLTGLMGIFYLFIWIGCNDETNPNGDPTTTTTSSSISQTNTYSTQSGTSTQTNSTSTTTSSSSSSSTLPPVDPPPTSWNPTIIINEVNWGGSTVASWDEFIELKNVSGSGVAVDNWKLHVSYYKTITLAGTMAADEIRLYQRSYSTSADESRMTIIPSTYVTEFFNAFWSISDTAINIWLEDDSGATIDSFGDPNGINGEEFAGYVRGNGVAAVANGFGYASAARLDSGKPGNDPSAWGNSTTYANLRSHNTYGNAMTPGAENSSGTAPAEVTLSGTLDGSWIGCVVNVPNIEITAGLTGTETGIKNVTVDHSLTIGAPGTDLILEINMDNFQNAIRENSIVSITNVPVLCPTSNNNFDWYIISVDDSSHLTVVTY